MVKISYARKIYKDLPWENLLNRKTLKHKKKRHMGQMNEENLIEFKIVTYEILLFLKYKQQMES